MDLLIINPGQGNNYKGYSELRAYEPPLWAGMIATFIRNHGYSMELLDVNIEGYSGWDNLGYSENPKLIAVVVYGHNPSSSTTIMPSAGDLCRKIKKVNPSQKIIMVGGHVAALPIRTLKEEHIDYVSHSEGPYRILGILRGDTEPLDIGESSIRDLDKDLPGVAWDLLPMDKYRAHNWHTFNRERQPYASLYTALGCPYSCDFCSIHAPFRNGPRYRAWSPESVLRQIDVLANTFGVKNLKIADELFVMPTDRVNQICDLLIERDYGLNIWAYARVDLWSFGLLRKLKRAGVNWLCLGIESAKGKGGDPFTAVSAMRGAGINVIGNFMFGFADDTKETMQDTLNLALELRCEFANFYCITAYPGSKLYERTDPKDLPETWEGYAQLSYEFKPLPTKHLSSLEVLRFRDKAFETYFNNPKYLDRMENKFGKEVRDQVQGMTSPTRRIADGVEPIE